MIFIDRSIPKSVASARKLVRHGDVAWLEDLYPHDVKDEVWIPEAGAHEYLAISRDKKIRTRPWQREMVKAHQVGCFILNQKRDPTRWEYLKLLAATLDEMELRFARTPRPFMVLVNHEGKFRDFPL